MAVPLTVAQACEWVERLFLFPLVEVDRKIVENAITIYKRYQLQYWDSVIISAAQRINADILYSEDMSHGQMYGSVRCINPFRTN